MKHYHEIGTVRKDGYWGNLVVTLGYDNSYVRELILERNPSLLNKAKAQVTPHLTSLDKKDDVICYVFWKSEEAKEKWISENIGHILSNGNEQKDALYMAVHNWAGQHGLVPCENQGILANHGRRLTFFKSRETNCAADAHCADCCKSPYHKDYCKERW